MMFIPLGGASSVGRLPKDAFVAPDVGETGRTFRQQAEPEPLDQDVIKSLLAAPPFTGRARIDQVRSTVKAPVSFAIAVPVRNEEALLPASLAALDAAMKRVEVIGAVVFVVNDSHDASSALILDWARNARRHVLVADTLFADEMRFAPFARRLALDLAAMLAPGGNLLTTDADSRVDPAWLAVKLAALREGADLVCGAVTIDEADLSRLPASVHECGALERAYKACSASLWHLWTGHDGLPAAIPALAASLAISTRCYRALGGLPTPKSGEDKALARLAGEAGMTIVCRDDALVVTSGRTEGRTPGGVSDALSERATSANPLCDDDLVPIALLHRRAELWNGLAPEPDRAARFAQALGRDPSLTGPRMRQDQVASELAKAEALLVEANATGDGADLLLDA